VIIDFIDMDDETNRRAVKAALDEALARDRTRTYVVDISPLGLVEMTRQNISDGPREIMTEVCPTCGGVGVVPSDETLAITVERELRESLARRPGGGAVAVTVHPRVADVLNAEDGARLADLAAEVGAEIRLERDGSLLPDAVRVRSLDEPVAAAAPAAPPTRSGARRRVSSRSG
jgi:ribonuclease G